MGNKGKKVKNHCPKPKPKL